MTDVAQNFSTYRGDDIAPIVTAYGDAKNTVPLDISTARDVLFLSWDYAAHTPGITKTKLTGGIAFVTDGTDGKVKITLLNADTTPFDAVLEWFLVVIDSFGLSSTVSQGALTIVPRPPHP